LERYQRQWRSERRINRLAMLEPAAFHNQGALHKGLRAVFSLPVRSIIIAGQ
jgi:hypothetical protein